MFLPIVRVISFCLLTTSAAILAQQPSATLDLSGLVDRPTTLTIDVVTGARPVQWLNRIEVRKVE